MPLRAATEALMASSARIDEIKKKFDENPRRYFAPLANEFRKAGDLEQAILICEEFLPQQAGHMSGHIVYGQALFEAGRLPESRTVFETALGLDPENLIALRHLGDIARAQGQPAEARRWYDRVLEADPRNDEIQGLLATLDADVSPAAPSMAETEPSGQAAAASAEYDQAPIELHLDDDDFAAPAAATPPPLPMGMPVTPSAEPVPDAPFDAISLDSLIPSTPATTPPPVPFAAQSPVVTGRAEGLEPAEFEVPTTQTPRAEGLEPAEFEAPSGVSMRAEGLQTTEFEAPHTESTDHSLLDLEGSFGMGLGAAETSASNAVTPLPGLEESGPSHPPAADEPPLPTLDLEEGLAVPAQATMTAHGTLPTLPDVPLGEAAAPGAENPRMEPPAAMEAMPALELDEFPAEESSPTSGLPMMELPPAVIAAESKLMDAGQSYGEIEPEESPRGGQAPFVTETMADLYLKQGFHAQALDVLRQLSAASPSDSRLRERVAELERNAAAPGSNVPTGETVREFLFRLATRRPGEGAAAAAPPLTSDFASFDAIPEHPIDTSASHTTEPARSWESSSVADDASATAPEPELEDTDETPSDSSALPFIHMPDEPSEPATVAETAPVPQAPAPVVENVAPPMPSAAERATSAQGGAPAAGGTIDALFGTRPASTSTDSAASALAQAFGGATEAPVISGRPARAATAELSLDSVFRDGPPRPPRVSQSFSFDQFFSESAADPSGSASGTTDTAQAGEPAERSADDVKQFNSWLQGLKPQ